MDGGVGTHWSLAQELRQKFDPLSIQGRGRETG